ncbi:MAG: FCD domain-containing protein [Flavimaricola sp.]|nr:FCD domain-containing protein [Flavimaricola sp.]
MGAAPADNAVHGSRGAADTIAQSLVEAIRSGDILDDQPLPTERELCDRFDASRPTVREALAQLQLRGYVSGGQGRRPRATRPSLASILRGAGDHLREVLGDNESAAHLEQMRHFIETGAAREAATRADTIRIAKLRDTLDRNFEAIGTPAFPTTDIAFHRALVAVLGNPVILTLHDMFVSDMLAKRPHLNDRLSHDQIVYEEHRQIYQAILDSNPQIATDVMDRHLARSYRSRLAAPQSLAPDPLNRG